MFNSIRWRIAIPYLVLILLTLAGTVIYISNYIREIYIRELSNDLLNSARLLREELDNTFADISANADLDELALEWSKLVQARLTLISADGTVIGESHDDRTRMDNHSSRLEILDAKSKGEGTSIRFSHTEGYDMLYAAVPVTNDATTLTGYIRLAVPLSNVQETIRHLQNTILLFSLMAMAIAVILAFWIASRSTKPLLMLTQAAEQLAAGDLDSRIVPTTSDEVGQLTRAFNLMADELSQKIEALNHERGKLAAVLSEMSDGVIIVDGQGVIQLINSAAESMFGVSHSDAMGEPLIHAIRQHQLVDLWKSATGSKEPQSAILELPARRLYLQMVATSFGKSLPDSTLLLFQNLTRLRHLETVRQDFISNISHELRTPLASLKVLSETLQETALDDPPAARRFLERMETEVDSLSMIVSELLELSRIESGRVPLRMEVTEPKVLIDQAVNRMIIQAQRKGLTITVDCPDNLPAVLVDPTRMEQVLVNLIHNAIKFTPEGGSITLKAENAAEKVLFSIQDTGNGITAEDLPRIFERFFKSDRARSGGGTGLGLAIAKHLVEAHGGKIWAESQEYVGSTFFFSVPIGV